MVLNSKEITKYVNDLCAHSYHSRRDANMAALKIEWTPSVLAVSLISFFFLLIISDMHRLTTAKFFLHKKIRAECFTPLLHRPNTAHIRESTTTKKLQKPTVPIDWGKSQNSALLKLYISIFIQVGLKLHRDFEPYCFWVLKRVWIPLHLKWFQII